MDGSRLRMYWSNEMEALFNTYKQFENLIPAKAMSGSDHNGEDGRYVEDLLKEYLKKYLPGNLEVFSGFILRPATKQGKDNSRKCDKDLHSSQLDLIIYDSGNYPVFHKYGDNAIVPPEGVLAVISVKKHLRKGEINHEINALKKVAEICVLKDRNQKGIRGPFLALVTMKCSMASEDERNAELVFEELSKVFKEKGTNRYDAIPGFVGSLSEWSIHKTSPMNDCAKYLFFKHKKEEAHLGFQFLLTEILGVFYDETRSYYKKPGFTSFESGREYDKVLGKIEFSRIRGR